MMKMLKNYMNNLLKSMPIAIISSCVSVSILMGTEIFKEFDLQNILLSFFITVVIMSHLVTPFSRIVSKINN